MGVVSREKLTNYSRI